MVALCIMGTISACSTATLASLPRSGADLGGYWVRDAAASDDGEQIIAHALPAAPKHHPDGEDGKDGFPDGPEQTGLRDRERPDATPPPVWSWRGMRDMVRAFALPPTQLSLLQEPSRIVIEQPERRRTFRPGNEESVSLTDRFGSRSVRVGWSGDALVIETSDKDRLKVVERYRRLDDDRLESAIAFQATHLKSIEIHTVYRRATGAETSGFCRAADDDAAHASNAPDPLSRRPCPE